MADWRTNRNRVAEIKYNTREAPNPSYTDFVDA